MDQRITTHSAEETKAFGKRLAGELLPGTLLCLTGDLGAGKTTLVQGLLEGLGAERPFVSPTFVLMKQYDLPETLRVTRQAGLPTPSATGIKRVYHADAYRVEAKDFREIGFAEWCADRDGLVILEWPERIAVILPDKRINIVLTLLSENERDITIKEKSARV